MITIKMIRWFVLWLAAFSMLLLVLGAFSSSSTRAAYTGLAILGTQVGIGLGWLVGHVAKLEEELAKYAENHADPEAAKKLAEFLRKSASIPAGQPNDASRGI